MKGTDPRLRLLELAGQNGVSLSALSAMIGRNYSYLQQYVRKGSPRKLEETDRRTLARFFGVGEDELGAPEDESRFGTEKSFGQDWIDVPRLALGASAGPGALAAGEQPIGVFRFSARWLREQGLDRTALSAIAIAGDSMEPTLRDGDEVLVDRTLRPLRDGVHVVRIGDTLLVKRIDAGRPGVLTLISDNPAYRPVELPIEEVEVIGRVVWKGGRL